VITKSRRHKPIKIAADVWNIWFRTTNTGDQEKKLEEIYNLQDALWVASVLNMFHRHCNTITLANMAQLVNVIAPMMTNQTSLVLQTTYYPLKLYTEHAGDVALDVLVRSDAFPQFADAPYLDVSATTTDSRGKFTLAVVNRNPSSDIAADVSVEGFNILSTADSYELNGRGRGCK